MPDVHPTMRPRVRRERDCVQPAATRPLAGVLLCVGTITVSMVVGGRRSEGQGYSGRTRLRGPLCVELHARIWVVAGAVASRAVAVRSRERRGLARAEAGTSDTLLAPMIYFYSTAKHRPTLAPPWLGEPQPTTAYFPSCVFEGKVITSDHRCVGASASIALMSLSAVRGSPRSARPMTKPS